MKHRIQSTTGGRSLNPKGARIAVILTVLAMAIADAWGAESKDNKTGPAGIEGAIRTVALTASEAEKTPGDSQQTIAVPPVVWLNTALGEDFGLNAPAPARESTLAASVWRGYKQIGYLTSKGDVQELCCYPDGHWQSADLMDQPSINAPPGAAGSPLVAYFTGGFKFFAYFTPDGHVHELACIPDYRWTHADLMQKPGVSAEAAAPGSALTASDWRGYRQLVYFSPDGHVQEFCCDAGGRWTHVDLMLRSNIEAPPAAPDSPLASFTWGEYKQIVYLTADGHVHELRCDPVEKWIHTDLMQAADLHSDFADPGTSLTACLWDGSKQIEYLTSDGHIQELHCDPTGKWAHLDLMKLPNVGAPSADPAGGLTSYEQQGRKQVAYLTPDGHVHDLLCDSDGKWTHADLFDNQGAGQRIAAPGSALVGYLWGAAEQVAYFDSKGVVHELSCER